MTCPWTTRPASEYWPTFGVCELSTSQPRVAMMPSSPAGTQPALIALTVDVITGIDAAAPAATPGARRSAPRPTRRPARRPRLPRRLGRVLGAGATAPFDRAEVASSGAAVALAAALSPAA